MVNSDPEKEREYQRRWREENVEKRREYARLYAAKNIEKKREYLRRWYVENAEKHRTNTRCWQVQNPEKSNAAKRRWCKENPEKVRESRRRWNAQNPEMTKAAHQRHLARQAKTSGVFSAEQFKALCAHFKYHCLKCGRPRKMTADHIIPLSFSDLPEFACVALGDIDNIQPLCGQCNSSKRDTHVDYRKRPHQNCLNPPRVEDYLA